VQVDEFWEYSEMYLDSPVVEGRKHPWLGRVHVDAFYPVGAGRKLPLDIKPKWLRNKLDASSFWGNGQKSDFCAPIPLPVGQQPTAGLQSL
jgi:hypothetical protein